MQPSLPEVLLPIVIAKVNGENSEILYSISTLANYHISTLNKNAASWPDETAVFSINKQIC